MMDFTLVKLLSLLIYPLSMSLLLGVVALVFSRMQWTRSSFYTLVLAFGWLYLCSTSLFASFITGTLEREFVPRDMAVIAPADAIVLLGGAMRGDTHIGALPDLNQHADRLVYAVALFKAGKAPLIVLTGGGVVGARTEAEQMKDLLEVMGVPGQYVLLENASRNTHDNAVHTAQLLKAQGMERILLVTSAYHMRRSLALFEAQGLDVVPAPTDYQRLAMPQILPNWLPTVSNLHQSTDALHEIVGYWVYRWRGWL
ncbi:Uncharacterised protein [Halioglobus japonicus]|nr:Uncharacterised protein [Halioglobus japonicus]